MSSIVLVTRSCGLILLVTNRNRSCYCLTGGLLLLITLNGLVVTSRYHQLVQLLSNVVLVTLVRITVPVTLLPIERSGCYFSLTLIDPVTVGCSACLYSLLLIVPVCRTFPARLLSNVLLVTSSIRTVFPFCRTLLLLFSLSNVPVTESSVKRYCYYRMYGLLLLRFVLSNVVLVTSSVCITVQRSACYLCCY